MGVSAPVVHQSMMFVLSALLGIALAFLYDLLRILRRAFGHGRLMVALEDLLFWCIVTTVIFYMLYTYDSGLIRNYTIVGMLAGMGLYNVTLGRHLVCFLGAHLKKIVNSLKRLLKKSLKPIRIRKNRRKKERLVTERGKAEEREGCSRNHP